MQVHGSLIRKWNRRSALAIDRDMVRVMLAIKMEETEEDRLFRELRGVESSISYDVGRELIAVKRKQGIKNPMVIKTTEWLRELLAKKIKILKEMIKLTKKQMKQDTLEYKLGGR